MSSSRYEKPHTTVVVNSERFTHEEIVFLLELCDKNDIISQSQSKGYSLVRAFTPIHKEMIENGYNRSLTQVIDKFRKLKLRFVHGYLARKRGKAAMANRFEHYRRFEKMLDNAKIDIDSFIRKFSKKDGNNSDDNNSSINYETIKDDNDDSRNILDYENLEFDTVALEEDDNDIIEKEVLLDDEYQHDVDMDYTTENVDIKIIPDIPRPSSSLSSSASNRNNDVKHMTPAERTVVLLEQLIPSFKQAQQELQAQFFRQQRELQRQQQEWEERILDEEREYFTKVISNLNNYSNQ